ncbi:MAG: phosphoribulokinase [Alphaproteobacteria bacterium]|nr:phosphoribulokinase [Alphaproteobacteria bacterium]
MPRVDHPIILGIVGDSAAGKTTLTRGIAQILGPERVAVICTDDYHKHSRADRPKTGLSALDPLANHIDIMEQHLQLLRQGRPILKPIYNHHGGTLDAPEYVAPKQYIILEGLLGYSSRKLRDCYDVKIYLEPDEKLRYRWKMQRDTGARGYTTEQVAKEMAKREKDSAAFIRPQRTFADIVVNFNPPSDNEAETGKNLNVRLVLRPTLPHPKLNMLLDGREGSGLHLALARDIDGKPVDVLEVYGDISDERARYLEEILWELIPEASHLRSNVGSFTDDKNRKAMSHPLALTQLLITFHMIKAALGEHAI